MYVMTASTFIYLVLTATVKLEPSLTHFMFVATTKLRWDEQNTLPQTHVRFIHVP
jgi:hypothetical protein